MSYLETLFSLKNKIAVVTGAARGNGRAISQALGLAGATLILTDILDQELNTTAVEFQKQGIDCMNFCGDITDLKFRDQLIDQITSVYGKVDVLVNNAAISLSHSPLDYPDEAWEKTYQINLYAPFKLATGFGKLMVQEKKGSIINITSLNAELAFPENPAYVAFKGALRQLTKSLALDLGKFGVRANNIGPGYFQTHMTKKSFENPELYQQRLNRTILNRWGKPDDLAGIAIFLASDASSYLTGQDIYVDGGWMIKGL